MNIIDQNSQQFFNIKQKYPIVRNAVLKRVNDISCNEQLRIHKADKCERVTQIFVLSMATLTIFPLVFGLIFSQKRIKQLWTGEEERVFLIKEMKNNRSNSISDQGQSLRSPNEIQVRFSEQSISTHNHLGSSVINNEQLSLLNKYQLNPDFLNQFPLSEYEIKHTLSQGSFYVDISNIDLIKKDLSSRQAWEPEILKLLQTHVKPGSIAIDIGAHIGTHTISMSRLVQDNGLVLAFEPQEKINRELAQNLKLNNCKNVIPIHAALGVENGTAYLEPIRPDNEGYRSISSKNPTEKISILKLDDFKLSLVSCMKIDVESYELEVLQGAKQTILSNKPAIIIEIGGGWAREKEENIDPKVHLNTVINMLEKDFNYEVMAISLETGDYLAIPKVK